MLRKTPALGCNECADPEASMRPQRNAAENYKMTRTYALTAYASMRPQRNAAENAEYHLDDAQ